MSNHNRSTKGSLEARCSDWLHAIDRFRRQRLILNPQKAALLVVDLQNYFLDSEQHGYMPTGMEILPNVQKLISAFHRADRPVIYTTHVHHPDGSDAGIMGWWWGDMIREGYPEAAIYAKIAPSAGEKVIVKHRYSAFYNTDLETVLRCGGIQDLVICGVMTNLCCESTARDAYYRDYRVFFLADATAAVSEEMHLATLMNLSYGFAHVGATEEILRVLE